MEKATTDQSIQVDFPNPNGRHIKRHNTSGDLYIQNRPAWTPIKPTISRPKSLNFATDSLNRNKIFYTTDTPLHQLHPVTTDIPIISISRERTPPYSCNSSLISNGYNLATKTNTNYKKKTDDESSGGSLKCCCNCRYPIDHPYPLTSSEKRWWRRSNMNTDTTDGLSWRRLHMSRAKLKATATTSELLSGFAMVAMVELQINEPTSVPEWLFVMFAVCTTVLVAVHIFALMISTYILPNIDAIAKLEVCEMVAESPHERMRGFIQLAWAFSTVLGLFLFLVEVAILCWVKFWDYSFTAAIAATVIVIPVLITFVLFAVHFYHSLVVYKCNASYNDMEKLENMKKHLDEIASPV